MLGKVVMMLRSPRGVWMLVALLVLAGGFLRFYHVGAQSYWMDEGYTVSAVQAIEHTGTSVLASGLAYHCPVYCWPTALIARTVGDTPTAYRVLAALAGTLVIALVFVVGRALFDVRVALIATAFTALSYIQIGWSRQARWYTLFELFFWLALFFFYRAYLEPKHRGRNYAFAALATVFATLTHHLGLLLPFIFLACAGIGWLRARASYARPLIYAGLLVVLVIGALALVAGNPLMWFSGVLAPHLGYPYYLIYYVRTYWPLLVLGSFVWLVPSPHRHASTYLLGAFAAYLVPLTFLTDVVQYRYLFHLTPVLFMVGAAGLLALSTRLVRPLHRVALTALAVVATLPLLFTVALAPCATAHCTPLRGPYYLESDPAVTYLLHPPYWAYVPQPDWSGAYAYIAAHRTPADVIVSSQAVFTKIYLHEPGYWLRYSLLGRASGEVPIVNGREYYAGAPVLDRADQVASLMARAHGFIILDFFATDGRIPSDTLAYIRRHAAEVYHVRSNDASEVWVYRF